MKRNQTLKLFRNVETTQKTIASRLREPLYSKWQEKKTRYWSYNCTQKVTFDQFSERIEEQTISRSNV